MVKNPDGPWVLGLDIGTSSARAIIFDSRGEAIEGLRLQRDCSPDHTAPGQSTFDANALVETVAHCIDGVLELAGDRTGNIAAVGVTTFWHSMVGVDANGKAVSPLYTWADTRSENAAQQLKQRLNPQQTHARTGCALHSSYYPARLLWLSEAEPELFHKVDRWLSPGEYLFQQLFGETWCSISMASATGLFNQNACDWDDETLKALPITRANLAPLTDIDKPVKGLLSEWSKRWPTLANIPWAPAIGDGAASNLGSGCVTDERIAINLGTSGAIRVLFPAQKVDIPDELWCYRLDRKRFIMGGAFSDGGDVIAWFKKTLNIADIAPLMREIEKRGPDQHCLTFLPFLSGERSIGWRPNARGTFHGLTLTTGAVDILQASMEAVALRFALVYNILHRQFPQASEIIASGGALAQAAVWGQMIADALGTPVTVAEQSEATSRGAALVALQAAGIINDVGDLPPLSGTVLKSDPARHEIFNKALDRQQRLYKLLLDFDASL
jgi:gluconokinase